MSNSEQGIFQAQAQAASVRLQGKDGLRDLQRQSVFYLDERVYVYLFAIVMVGLFILWVTSKSALLNYGSLGVAILLTFAWGVFRIRGVERRRRQYRLEACSFEAARSARNLKA